MARHERLIAFLEREAQLLRTRIDTLENKGWPIANSPGEEEGVPDRIETLLAEHRDKLEEIESHIAELKSSHSTV